MSLVDPFIPVNKPPHQPLASEQPSVQRTPLVKPKPGLVNNVSPYIIRRPPKAAEHIQIQHKVQQHRPLPAYPVPTSVEAAPKPQPRTKQKRKKLRRVLSTLHLVLGTALIMGLGLFMPSQVIGEVCIGAYALVALIFRFPSNAIFALAATSLIGILIAQRFQDYSPVASVAIYTFLLLTVGALSLIRETMRRSKAEA